MNSANPADVQFLAELTKAALESNTFVVLPRRIRATAKYKSMAFGPKTTTDPALRKERRASGWPPGNGI